MLIRSFERGRCLVARLDHGMDIIGQITDLAKEKEIEIGFLSAIGALSRAELGYYDLPFVHAHAVLSDREGRVWGGHLNSGMVFAAELYMQELLGLPLKRVPDSITGLNLWSEE